ncbi:hypothetical protein BDP27DRAFT_1313519 [Rhodocollybia butyracea]|uniref:Uncharacterized protein n=1 Tax=Rhodocollybia butyracea TaxID=206335 RepID=A0A9P5Q8E1_9AGAR|nr:hypothetical protein BDP27DRAFT_1313519 [Rhodocollybia butyracea]
MIWLCVVTLVFAITIRPQCGYICKSKYGWFCSSSTFILCGVAFVTYIKHLVTLRLLSRSRHEYLPSSSRSPL